MSVWWYMKKEIPYFRVSCISNYPKHTSRCCNGILRLTKNSVVAGHPIVQSNLNIVKFRYSEFRAIVKIQK